MSEQAVHILVDGFTTACGLARHFTCGVQPYVAHRLSEVTCETCRKSKSYEEWKSALINEGIYDAITK